MKVFLVGFMGCGKSTIGKILARNLSCQFIDMDKQLSARQGLSINEIFSRYGESHFRRLEQEFLHELASEETVNAIIATGGGTACNQDNLELMLKSGIVVYLKRTRQELLRRLIAGQHSRPLIQNKNPQQISEFIENTLAIREPFYSRANIIVDCDHIGDSSAVNVIRMALEMGHYQQDSK
jgi:shikimate kinase